MYQMLPENEISCRINVDVLLSACGQCVVLWYEGLQYNVDMKWVLLCLLNLVHVLV